MPHPPQSPGGFSPTFPIAQGTREGCILSPSLFLTFANAMRVLQRVNLDEGAIMMGALSMVYILFADDDVLLARCISDTQMLSNTFSAFCNSLHENITLEGKFGTTLCI